jgi:SAM-dependent methyltransferase
MPNLGLARCRSCHLVNTVGANLDEVADAYTTDYYGSASSKFVSIIERILSLSTGIRARKITRAWRRGQHPNKLPAVLDIGCGRGQLLRAFQSMGATVLGLEREEFPAYETPGNIVRVGSIGNPEYADRQFDIVILWHVLEHLEKHEELLDEITNHLDENGLLIIAVPNFSSLQQRIFSKYWFHLDLPRHLVHFDAKWLVKQLSNRGYAIESTSYVDPLQNIYGFIQSTLNAIAPRQLNDYYRLLKHGRPLQSKTVLPILKWSVLSMVLLPFAIFENILGTLLRRGATVQIVAKKEKER